MTHEEMIAVIQAHKEGKKVQSRPKGDNIEWMDELQPLFDFEEYDWRIKSDYPEHKFNEGERVNVIGTDINEIIQGLKFYSNKWLYSLTNRDWYFESQLQKYIEPHYRPFKNAEEVMAAIREHGSWVCDKEGRYYNIVEVYDFGINIGTQFCRGIKWSQCVGNITFADGTPFGVMED